MASKIKPIKQTSSKQVEKKAFTHAVAVLRKQGVFFGNVKRSSQVKMTTANLNKVNQFKDVVEGKKRFKKLKTKDAKAYRDAEFLTYKNMVAIEVGAGDRLTTKNGHVVKWPKLTKGQTAEVIIPANAKSLNDYFDALDDEHINALKRKGEAFGFQFFGNNSNSSYFNIDTLRSDLMAYRAILAAGQGTGEHSETEVLRNIKIVRINSKKEFPDTTWSKGHFKKVNAKGRNDGRLKLPTFIGGSKEADSLGNSRIKDFRRGMSEKQKAAVRKKDRLRKRKRKATKTNGRKK